MAPEIIKGLKDVYFDTTTSSFIDGQEGKLLYRGYNIHDLAEKSTFEEVVYLLLYRKLPNKQHPGFRLGEGEPSHGCSPHRDIRLGSL